MHRERRLISLKEAADYLGISPSNMYRMLKRGEIATMKIGDQWYFTYADLDQWIDSRPKGATRADVLPPRKKSPKD